VDEAAGRLGGDVHPICVDVTDRDALAAFQPQEIGFIADPYPAYDELRRAGRIHYDERTDHWLITRHADVNALLRDRAPSVL